MSVTKAPHILRIDVVERLLAHHRACHGVARVIGSRGEGLGVRVAGERVATLQASGPREAVKGLHIALEAILETERMQEERQRVISERIVGLTRRLREVEDRMLSSLEHRKLQLLQQQRRLADVAATDPLTGTLNRRAFEASLAPLCQASAHTRDPVAVLFCDVDHFKAVNDTHGHAAGDRVLTRVGELLRAGRRKGDLVARWGGEEFVVVLPDCEQEHAMAVAERMRVQLKELVFEGEGSFSITMSVGVAVGVPRDEALQEDAASLIQTADQRLYEAKQSGRDRVEGGGRSLRMAG